MLTFRDMAKVTPRPVIDKARGIRYRLVRYKVKASLADGPWVEYTLKAISQQSRGGMPGRATATRQYDILIRQYATRRASLQRGFTPAKLTWLHCACPYFTYYCEYVLAEAGSSVIQNSNGEPPVVRNSRGLPYMCKHLAAIGLKGIRTRMTDARMATVFGAQKTWSRKLFRTLHMAEDSVLPAERVSGLQNLDTDDLALLGALEADQQGTPTPEQEQLLKIFT